MPETCKICASATSEFSEAVILKKHKIKYYKCSHCDFVQTEKPFWLNEAYAAAINESDVGLIKRNLELVSVTRLILSLFFNRGKKFLDFGAGYGMFVRLMRDYGYDFYWYDKYCENLFAKHFEAGPDTGVGYELVTGFELFEHLPDPLEEIQQMLKFSSSILFSTELFPKNMPLPGTWWYYGLDHGQHVSIYSLHALKHIATKFNLNLYTNGKSLHLLTKKKIPGFLFKLFSYHQITGFFNPFTKQHSLLDDDYQKIVSKSG